MSGHGVVLPPEGLRGLLLDIDDTLISTRESMCAAAAAATTTVWPDVAPERAAAAGERYRQDPGGHFRAYTRGEHDVETMRRRRVEDLADWLGVRSDGDTVRRWRDVFDPGLIDGLRVFDDVQPALQLCGSAGLPVALLTNAPAAVTAEKLNRCGLEELRCPLGGVPVPIVTKDTLGRGKPDPAVFHHACALLGLQPSQVAYVGDELDVDPIAALDAALDAGLGAVWVRRPGYDVTEPDRRTARRRGLEPLDGLHAAVTALVAVDAGGFGSAAAAR